MRLIDVDAFEKWAWRNPDIEVDGENYVSMYAASNFALDHEITPDSLVKRGRWTVGLDGSCMCSECGKVVRYDIENYCPRCGARLEAED